MQDAEQRVGVWIPDNIEDSIVPSPTFATEARLLCVMVFQLERVMAALGLALTPRRSVSWEMRFLYHWFVTRPPTGEVRRGTPDRRRASLPTQKEANVAGRETSGQIA